MITITPPLRRPSNAEWAAHLPRICELYYGERCTLEDTQRTVQQERGFYATLRMYKHRIRNMAVHPKKISMQKYQAMGVVAEDYQRYGITVYFVGPSGFQLFKRTCAQITKQLRRPHCVQSFTLEEARSILRHSSIQSVVEHAASTSQTSQIVAAAPEILNNGTSLTPLAESYELNQDYWTAGGLNLRDEVLTRQRLGTRNRSGLLSPISPNIMRGHPIVSDATAEPGVLPFIPTEPRATGISNRLSLTGLNLVPDRLSETKSTHEEDTSYDFVADFDELSMLATTMPATVFHHNAETTRILPPPSAFHRRRMATECAAPFVIPCFLASSSTEGADFSKAEAMQKFRYILSTTPENEYLLPLLNWMSTVLASNGRLDQLNDFVVRCCQVLDNCPEHGFPLATPYRYTLAFCNEDEQAIALHGSHFAAGTERLTRLYGPCHPNVLVNEHFRAWHEMSSKSGWSNARAILESCLAKTERVMGHHNLMAINCLAVLGRGFAENNLHDQARSTFQDIIERLGLTVGPLQAYRLIVLQQLATEEEHFGDLEAAELRYREVYEGRMYCLSASNPETKAAMCSLASLLHRQGRHGEAHAVEWGYDQTLKQQSHRDSSLFPLDHAEQQSMTVETNQP